MVKPVTQILHNERMKEKRRDCCMRCDVMIMETY